MGVRVWQSDGDDAGGSFSTCLEWETGMETGEKIGKKKRMTETMVNSMSNKCAKNTRISEKYDDVDHFTYMLLVK